MNRLTGVFVIESGVLNRGDGIGNIASVKKVSTYNGLKVFFSPVSYKRALWDSLRVAKDWSSPIVTREGGVVQRTGTVIDCEEFDFGGTMVAKPKYERCGTLLVDNGISVNDFAGDMEFMTNMAISKLYGENEANIINKENFHGVYLLPFVLELDRVGVQEIASIDTKIAEGDDNLKKMSSIYKAINLKDSFGENEMKELEKRVAKIDYDKDKKVTTIALKKEERIRRIKDLLEGMGDLCRRIEGANRNLSPFFAVFSLDYFSPKYLLEMKRVLSAKEKLTEEVIRKYAQNDGKSVLIARDDNYQSMVTDLINKIEGKLS